MSSKINVFRLYIREWRKLQYCKEVILMDYENFVPERIAKLRQDKGVSARDMSLSMGQNVNYINHIENRKTEPSLSNLFGICDYFGITPQEFFDEDNQQPATLRALIADIKRLNENALIHLTEFIKEISKKQK